MNSTIGRLPLRYLEIVSEVPNNTVAPTASAMALSGSSGSIRSYRRLLPATATFSTAAWHAFIRYLTHRPILRCRRPSLLTVDHEKATEIAAEMATTAHSDTRRWMSGDRTVNNRWRPDP
jgi:hypothetical protein